MARNVIVRIVVFRVLRRDSRCRRGAGAGQHVANSEQPQTLATSYRAFESFLARFGF